MASAVANTRYELFLPSLLYFLFRVRMRQKFHYDYETSRCQRYSVICNHLVVMGAGGRPLIAAPRHRIAASARGRLVRGADAADADDAAAPAAVPHQSG